MFKKNTKIYLSDMLNQDATMWDEVISEKQDLTNVAVVSDFATKAAGSFVIKSVNKDRIVSTLKELSFDELSEIYPFIKDISEAKKIKEPLLILSEKAVEGIKKHISWDKQTADNVYEQGGILIGKPYLINKQIVGFVELIIPAETTRSNYTYLEMGTETWIKMLDIYDQLYKDNGLLVIGWFHTHPNNLSVFMSSTDMGTQRTFFNQQWHFSIVLNPHRRLIACFNSEAAKPCDYYPQNFTER